MKTITKYKDGGLFSDGPSRRRRRKKRRRQKQQGRINRRDKQLQPSTPGQKIFGPIAGFGSVIGLKKLIDKFTEED